jgi:fumarate reductase subunit C
LIDLFQKPQGEQIALAFPLVALSHIIPVTNTHKHHDAQDDYLFILQNPFFIVHAIIKVSNLFLHFTFFILTFELPPHSTQTTFIPPEADKCQGAGVNPG